MKSNKRNYVPLVLSAFGILSMVGATYFVQSTYNANYAKTISDSVPVVDRNEANANVNSNDALLYNQEGGSNLNQGLDEMQKVIINETVESVSLSKYKSANMVTNKQSVINKYINKAGGLENVKKIYERIAKIKDENIQENEFEKLTDEEKLGIYAGLIPTKAVFVEETSSNKVLNTKSASTSGCKDGRGGQITGMSSLAPMYLHKVVADVCWSNNVVKSFKNRKDTFTPIDSGFFTVENKGRSRFWGPKDSKDYEKRFKNKSTIYYGSSYIYKLCLFKYGCLTPGIAKLDVELSGKDGKATVREQERKDGS